MAEPELVKVADGQYRLEGEITFTVVSRLADKRLESNGHRCHIALDQLERADSSVLALLLRWLRREKAKGVELSFSGFSRQLLSLIDLYELGGLLGESSLQASA